MSDEVCQVKMQDGKPCGRQAYKDKKKCIFHLKNKLDEEAKVFEIAFWKELERMEKDNGVKELDFTGFIFPVTISFQNHLFEKQVIFTNAQFNSDANFIDAKFNDKENFMGNPFSNIADFSGAKFSNLADFSGAEFSVVHFVKAKFSEADFANARFNNRAEFIEATFSNFANFIWAKFSEADFANARFNNRTDFIDTKFNNEANFNEAQFNNKVNFINAQFNNIAHFSGAKFIGEVNFSEVQFNVEADFSEAQFYREANFSYAYFHLAEFIDSKFYDVTYFIEAEFSFDGEFINVKFHKPKAVRFQCIDLNNVYFSNTDISEVEFLDERWARKNGRLIVADETRIGDEEVPYGELTTTYGAVAQLYRRLRRNYESNYRFSEAGDFFIGEMEMRRLDVNTDIKNERIRNIVLWLKKIKIRDAILWFKRNFSLLGLYKLLSLYGENYVRPMIWASIVIVSYPMLVHWLFNASLPQSDDFPYTYLRTSAASFFQMDSTYIGERIIGFLILGLLFIALKRKFERKK